MLVLQKNPLPVEQKLEMYLSNSTLPTYLSHSNSVIFRMVPESTSMEMEQKQESDCTKVLVHSSDSVVQQNLVLSTFLHRFQHSSSSVEILEKEKPMHIKVLVHSSDSILQQKSELLPRTFWSLQGSGYRCRSKNQGIYWFWYIRPQYKEGWGRCFWQASLYQCSRIYYRQPTRRNSSILLHWCFSYKRTQVTHWNGFPLRIYRSSRIQRSFTRFYGLFKVQGSGEESRSRIYTGTGRVFGFTGGAEATAVTENVPGSLFKLTGTVEVLFQRTPFIGSGSLFSFTGSTETTAVVPPVATLFEFNGNSAESRTRPYRGSGTLVTFQSATSQDAYHTMLRKVSSNLLEHSENLLFLLDTLVRLEFSSLEHPQIEELNLNHRNQLRYTSFKH